MVRRNGDCSLPLRIWVAPLEDDSGKWLLKCEASETCHLDAVGSFWLQSDRLRIHVTENEPFGRVFATRLIDLIRKFDGPGASFSDRVNGRIDDLLSAVHEVGAVLDVNPGAHRRGLSPVYPLPGILKRARQMGVGVTLGDDGHGAHDVGVGLEACMTAIANAGYREVHYLARDGDQVVLRSAPIDDVGPSV